MQPLSLDFVDDDSKAGFRLHRLEILNWGTFHRHIWDIAPQGHNALLTGDIGSGKSTLVDALTTLLVPHNRIVYNKAAGAENKERSLYSYIRGEYKSSKDDLTQAAKAVALRDESSYTVLLAQFYNQGFSQQVTIAQVFWLKDGKRNPERFFVISHKPLSIADDFSQFGEVILDLKKRLRKQDQVEVFDQFKDYSQRFRHLFGIQNEQALELFYQTVSMKSVGNLTDFVRHHMLGKGTVTARIDELRQNFDNLNLAHLAIMKAKDQITRLLPLVKECDNYRTVNQDLKQLRNCRDHLSGYYAHHHVELLLQRITVLEQELSKIDQRLIKVKEELFQLKRKQTELKRDIDDSGGRRLQQIEDTIGSLAVERDKKRERNSSFQQQLKELDRPPVLSEDDFYINLTDLESLLKTLDGDIAELKNSFITASVDLQAIKGQVEQLEAELESLRSRRSNIPLRNLQLRQAMLDVLGVDAAQLPFVGELLQVDEGEAVWEGAIERVLHNFGLSLLVPESLYEQVNVYVERTRLKGRIVYYKVKDQPQKRSEEPATDALCRKVKIRADSPFYSWLESALVERFNYICCEQLETFRRQPKAITLNGQIKSAGQRHEKDDRRSLQDRSRYILGWSNEEKISALEQQKKGLEHQGQQLAEQIDTLQQQEDRYTSKRDTVRDLQLFTTYDEIAWEPVAQRIQELAEEKEQIEKSSDRLKELRYQLTLAEEKLELKDGRQKKLFVEQGGLKERHEQHKTDLLDAETLVLTVPDDEKEILFPVIDALRQSTDKSLTLATITKAEQATRAQLQTKVDQGGKRSETLSSRITQQMESFKNSFQAETNELDASLDAMEEFEQILTRLQGEDLPRHEKRFRQLLKEGTIKSVVLLQNQLGREQEQIKEKINKINTSLREIEYNPGTYIELVMDRSQDAEIRDFQQDLKQCLAHTLDEEELYTEEKFYQVKEIIDRFNGRDGFTDLDRRWTTKVTDVRNWFSFSGSERWMEDDSEKEYYSDSSGKSGGQKEKLAYTILASALAYQFGLEWGATTSRSFRFVVIDEAFGKGSDESTAYGLELFKKLNLQLLIVTPLQKIHVIEDYIRSVHYVHNQEGANSVLRNMTLEEYRYEKQKYQEGISS